MIPLGVMASGRVAPTVTGLQGAILGLSPSHYYPMTEGAGTSLVDVVAGLNATLTGSYTWGAGLSAGDAASVAFTSAHASTADLTASAAHLTAMALVRPSSIISNDNIFQHEPGATGNIRFRMRLVAGVPEIILNVSGVKSAVSTLGALTAGATYLITGTFDGSNIRLYVNGTLARTTAATGSAFSTTTPVRIGAYTTTPTDPFDGRIGHAAYWSGTALSGAQVASLATAAGL